MKTKYVLTKEKLEGLLSAAWYAGFDESNVQCNGDYISNAAFARIKEIEQDYTEVLINSLDDHVLNY